MLFDACDLDFDPMTLVLKLNQDIMVTYWYTTNEVNSSLGSKVMAWKLRQTDTQTDMCKITCPVADPIII